MTKRQQRRAEKANKKSHTTHTPKKSTSTNKPIVKKADNITNSLKKIQLEKISGYMKGILKAKHEQEERELMWKLIKKYEAEVMRAFTPYA